jgi:hypothetical protein
MADAIFQKSDVAVVIDENLIPSLQEILQNTPGFHQTITDVSQYAEMGVDRVEFPKVGPVATQDATNTMEFKKREYALDVLMLNIERGHCFFVKNSLKKESKINITEQELTDGLTAILNDRDEAIHNAMFANAKNSVTRTANIGNDIVEARKKLVDEKVKIVPGGQVAALNSIDMAKVLKDPSFIDASKLANAAIPLVTGAIGRIYGFDVVEHTLEHSLLYSRKAAVYADHGTLDVNEGTAVKDNAKEWSEVLKFGTKVLQDGAYIVKLVDPAN